MSKLLNKFFLLILLLGLASPSLAQTTYTDRFSGSVIATIGKQPVVVATTANIGLFYSQTIDGVVVSDHTTDGTGQKADRVLVKNQIDQTQNGIYVVSNTGAWTRAQDFSGNSGVVQGQLVTANGGTQAGFWTLTSADPIAVGPNNNVMSGTPSNITFVATTIPVPQNLALASGNLFVGNVSGNATARALSGDCTLSNTGGITCTKTNGVNFSTAATAAETDGLCMVGTGGAWVAGSCTGPSGSGTVSIGTATHLGYYAASTNVISSNSFLTIGTTGILSATGFSGPLTGAVTGNVTGNLTGNVTATSVNVSSLTASSLVGSDGSKNLVTTTALPSSTTATTQSAGDTSTKVATMQAFSQGANGASVVLLATATASNSVSIQFTSIPSGYDQYKIIITNANPATNLVTFRMQMSEDNGSTWKNSGYQYGYNVSTSSGGNFPNGSTGDSSISISGSTTIPAGTNYPGASGEVDLYSLSSSSIYKAVRTQMAVTGGGTDMNSLTLCGVYSGDAGAVNAIKFFMASGNISSGKFALYGIRNQ